MSEQILDSGSRREYKSGAVRDVSEGKGRFIRGMGTGSVDRSGKGTSGDAIHIPQYIDIKVI